MAHMLRHNDFRSARTLPPITYEISLSNLTTTRTSPWRTIAGPGRVSSISLPTTISTPPAAEMKSGGASHELTRPVFAPGFRDLSNEFLDTEAKRHYVVEALLFAIIVGISAWPIVSMMRALAQLMK